MYPIIRSWPEIKNINLLGFAGYKAGMTHVQVKDTRPHSLTKNEVISWPVTIVECPPLRVLSIRLYKKDSYGSRVAAEVMASNVDKSVSRKITMPKTYDQKAKLDAIEKDIEKYSDVLIKVYTQPTKSALTKKKPEIFEIGLGGHDVKAKFEHAKNLLDKEIRVSDVLKQGTKMDIHAVTTGRGFQGVVKRFGVGLRQKKSEKKLRGSVLNGTTPRRIRWACKMAGQMGFHTRTEYNKDIIFVSNDVAKVNRDCGLKHYGVIKSEYLLVKGSVGGPVKRLIRFVTPVRNPKNLGEQIQVINIERYNK